VFNKNLRNTDYEDMDITSISWIKIFQLIFTKIGNRLYKGSPSDQVQSWYGDFRNLFDGGLHKVVETATANDPVEANLTGL